MKKKTKNNTALVTVCVCIFAAAALVSAYRLAFPGLGDYIAVRTDCPGAMSVALSEFPYYGGAQPDDWEAFSAGGIEMRLPQGAVTSASDAETVVYSSSAAKAAVVVYPQREAAAPTDMLADSLEDCCAAMGWSVPETEYMLTARVLSIRSSDFDLSDSEKSAAIRTLAGLKYEKLGGDLGGGRLYSSVYAYDRGNIKGILYHLAPDDGSTAYLAELYMDGDFSTVRSLVISSQDSDTVYGILASLRLERDIGGGRT